MKFKTEIDGKELDCQYTGKTARLYREQFRSDLLIDLNTARFEMIRSMKDFKEVDEFSIMAATIDGVKPEQLEKFMWAALASAGSINEPFDKWIDSIENYNDTIMICGTTVFQTMIGNVQTVSPDEPAEETTEDKKKS